MCWVHTWKGSDADRKSSYKQNEYYTSQQKKRYKHIFYNYNAKSLLSWYFEIQIIILSNARHNFCILEKNTYKVKWNFRFHVLCNNLDQKKLEKAN